MPTRLRRRLTQAALERRGILMGFLPTGYPAPDRFRAAASAAFDSGLDALEVSMPGPAPELDGPLIQSAALEAASHGLSIADALRLAAASRSHPDDTIVALAYLSTFDTITTENFLAELEAADVDALLLPQHPIEEQLDLGIKARARGIEQVIFLYREEDLATLAASPLIDPVIYLQSSDLRTGEAFNPDKAEERLEELSAALHGQSYFVCVGFGVRGHDEARLLMSAGADGVIIGTRLVLAAAEGPDAVASLVDEVAPALMRRHSTDPHPARPMEATA